MECCPFELEEGAADPRDPRYRRTGAADGKTSRRAHAPHMTQTNGSAGSTILAFRFRSLLRWPQGPPYQLSLTNPIRILGLASDR